MLSMGNRQEAVCDEKSIILCIYMYFLRFYKYFKIKDFLSKPLQAGI